MKIYCSGIGGIGLSAYASLMHQAGHEVLGSDRTQTELTKRLESDGITVYYDQSGESMPTDIDMLVYSEAIDPTAPERAKASVHNIRQLSYFAALGEYSKDYVVVAICGTHGKSSTTAMVAQVFVENGLDPTVVVGTKVPFLDGQNWRKGKSNIFVVEACEYKRSFLYLKPNVVLLTNADGDHFDVYADESEYTKAFADFLELLPSDGTVITHGSNQTCAKLAVDSKKTVINVDENTLPMLNVIGEHMQQNAQLVLGLTGVFTELTKESTLKSLAHFTGTWRRLERIGMVGQHIVYDDYGHHPHEITANLAALRGAYPLKQIVLIIQPHMQSRVQSLYAEFTTAFKDASIVLMVPIYEARTDTVKSPVDMDKFCKDIEDASGRPVQNVPSLEDITNTLHKGMADGVIQDDAVICFMGAGNITNYAHKFVK